MVKWNDNDIKLLKEKFASVGSNIPELCKKFTRSAIRHKASRLKLKYKDKNIKYWTLEEDEYIKKYINTKTFREIANNLGRTRKSVAGRIYRSLNVKSGCWRKINENFFKEWSEEMAYILGYWFADGYMSTSKNSFVVGFSSKDISIIKKIRKALDTNYKISTNKKLMNGNKYIIYNLCISNKKTYDNIKKLGGVERKSLIITFPEVPYQYVRHFIRGYFDGDGSITIRKRCNPSITFVGTESFINKLIEYLPYQGKIIKTNNIYLVCYSGNRAQNILEYMYTDSTIYLSRKYKLYKKGMKWKRYGWTEEEKLLLKENYPLLGYKIPKLLYTRSQILRKAQKMSLKFIGEK